MIKVGDFVRSKRDRSISIVVEVNLWGPKPLSPENHGSIEVKTIDIGQSSYLQPGDLEHYCVYKWQEDLKIITEEVKIENLTYKLHQLNKTLIFT